MIRKEAWSFYRTISGVRLSWKLERPKGPEGPKCFLCSPFYGKACRWAKLGELKPKGPKRELTSGTDPGLDLRTSKTGDHFTPQEGIKKRATHKKIVHLRRNVFEIKRFVFFGPVRVIRNSRDQFYQTLAALASPRLVKALQQAKCDTHSS